ncbi:hypothetical protein PM082_009284 [Marasmius tenuissimus]|nr:hypothetical protein PM082_009284 [Marasmius tenuissimus]
MQMSAPSTFSTGMEQCPSMDLPIPNPTVLHDIENGPHVSTEIRGKEKGRTEGGWLSKWTSGGHDKVKDEKNGRGQREERQSWQLVHPEKQGELTDLIGFLAATSSEDSALVLDVCERASANDSNAKEAMQALRREFKHGQPKAQLGAARLWAFMLTNSSDTFINQSTSRKFLKTLEKLLASSKTSLMVKECVLNILAAAAYSSGSKEDTAFRGLWKKVKSDEAMPFDPADAMFNSSVFTSGTGERRSTVVRRNWDKNQDKGRKYSPRKDEDQDPLQEHEKRHRPSRERQRDASRHQLSHSRRGKNDDSSPKANDNATKEKGRDSLFGIDDSFRSPRYSPQDEPSDARYTSPLSPDSSVLGFEEEAKEKDPGSPHTPLGEPADTPPSTSDRSGDVTGTSASTPVHNLPPSLVFLDRSDSPIVRPLSVVSSATTVPPYFLGDHPRSRRDTLASTRTYETLPSYHSRRSTRLLSDSDMVPNPTTRNIRPLPPIPPLPSFIS